MVMEQARHWRSAADALAVLRRESQVTRPELGERLGLRSGPTSDLVKRLSNVALITERPTVPTGRGRPTTTVHGHPAGPVAAVLDLRHGDWRLGTCEVDGEIRIVETGRHDGTSPDALLLGLRARIRDLIGSLGGRVAGLGVAVPGTAAENRLVTVTMLGWRDLEFGAVSPDPGLPLVVANDATMAAVTEARLHTPAARALLHVVVEVGIGGAFIVDGEPVGSARGLHGEFGHLPFGDPGSRCPCGARGCWTIAFDAPQIAERTGLEAKGDPRDWLLRLFTELDVSSRVRETRASLAEDLGRGIAGLVNALDPDLVTLGGIAGQLREVSPDRFDQALLDGLMHVHRQAPPEVVAARSGEDAPLVGVGLSVFEQVLDAEHLAQWATRQASQA